MDDQLEAGTILKVTENYNPKAKNELHLQVGDLLAVEALTDEDRSVIRPGFIKGTLREGPRQGQTGFFPSRVVDVEGLQSTTTSALQLASAEAEPSGPAATLTPDFAAPVELFTNGIPLLSRRGNSEHTSTGKNESMSHSRTRSATAPHPKSLLPQRSQSNLSTKLNSPLPSAKSLSSVSVPTEDVQRSKAMSKSVILVSEKLDAPGMPLSKAASADSANSLAGSRYMSQSLTEILSKRNWKDDMDEEHLAVYTPEEITRQQIIWELFATEAAYVHDLSMVVDVFMKPMLDRRVLGQKNAEALFGNISEILKMSKEFLERLQNLYENAPSIENFGTVFLTLCLGLPAYTTYCSNNAKALDKLKEFSKVKTFRAFLQECYMMPVCRQLDLGSFLIKPVQRICKYPLFLQQILSNTPEKHADRTATEQALIKLQQVLKIVNAGVDGIQKMTLLQNSFAERIELVAPSRYLIREDTCLVFTPAPECKQKSRRLFLFNDMILLAKKDWRERYHLIDKVDTQNAQVVEIHSETSQQLLELHLSTRHYLVMMFDQEMKEQWLSAFRDTASANKVIRKELDPGTDSAVRASMRNLAEANEATPSFLDEDSSQVAMEEQKPSPRGSPVVSSHSPRRPSPLHSATLILVDAPSLERVAVDAGSAENVNDAQAKTVSMASRIAELDRQNAHLKRDRNFLHQSLMDQDNNNKRLRVEIEAAQIALKHETEAREQKQAEIERLKQTIVSLEVRNNELADTVRRRDIEIHTLKTKNGSLKPDSAVGKSRPQLTDYSHIQSRYSQASLASQSSLLSLNSKKVDVKSSPEYAALNNRVKELELENQRLAKGSRASRLSADTQADIVSQKEKLQSEVHMLRQRLSDITKELDQSKSVRLSNDNHGQWREMTISNGSLAEKSTAAITAVTNAKALNEAKSLNDQLQQRIQKLESEKKALSQTLKDTTQRYEASVKGKQAELDLQLDNGSKMQKEKAEDVEAITNLKAQIRAQRSTVAVAVEQDGQTQGDLLTLLQHELGKPSDDLHFIRESVLKGSGSEVSVANELLLHNRVLAERVAELQSLCERAKNELKKPSRQETRELSAKLTAAQVEIASLRQKLNHANYEEFELKQQELETLKIALKQAKEEIHELQADLHAQMEQAILSLPSDELLVDSNAADGKATNSNSRSKILQRTHTLPKQISLHDPNFIKRTKSLLKERAEETQDLHEKVASLVMEKEDEVERLTTRTMALEEEARSLESFLQEMSYIQTLELFQSKRRTKVERGKKVMDGRLSEVRRYIKELEDDVSLKTKAMNRIAAILPLETAVKFEESIDSSAAIEALLVAVHNHQQKHASLDSQLKNAQSQVQQVTTLSETARQTSRLEVEDKEKQITSTYSQRLTDVERTLKEKIAQLEKELNENNKTLHDLNDRLQKAIGERESLRGQCAILTEKLDHCLMENAHEEETMNEQKSTLADRNKEIESLRVIQKDLEKRLKVVDESRDLLEKETIELKEKLKTTEFEFAENLESVTTELDQVMKWKETAEVQMTDLQFRIHQAHREQQRAEEAANLLFQAKAQLEREIKDRVKFIPKNEHDMLAKHCDRLSMDLKEIETERDLRTTEYKKLQKEFGSLKDKYDDTVRQLQEKTSQNDKMRQLVEEYKLHAKDSELRYDQSMLNRERDIDLLKLEVIHLSRQIQQEAPVPKPNPADRSARPHQISFGANPSYPQSQFRSTTIDNNMMDNILFAHAREGKSSIIPTNLVPDYPTSDYRRLSSSAYSRMHLYQK